MLQDEEESHQNRFRRMGLHCPGSPPTTEIHPYLRLLLPYAAVCHQCRVAPQDHLSRFSQFSNNRLVVVQQVSTCYFMCHAMFDYVNIPLQLSYACLCIFFSWSRSPESHLHSMLYSFSMRLAVSNVYYKKFCRVEKVLPKNKLAPFTYIFYTCAPESSPAPCIYLQCSQILIPSD